MVQQLCFGTLPVWVKGINTFLCKTLSLGSPLFRSVLNHGLDSLLICMDNKDDLLVVIYHLINRSNQYTTSCYSGQRYKNVTEKIYTQEGLWLSGLSTQRYTLIQPLRAEARKLTERERGVSSMAGWQCKPILHCHLALLSIQQGVHDSSLLYSTGVVTCYSYLCWSSSTVNTLFAPRAPHGCTCWGVPGPPHSNSKGSWDPWVNVFKGPNTITFFFNVCSCYFFPLLFMLSLVLISVKRLSGQNLLLAGMTQKSTWAPNRQDTGRRVVEI